MKKDTLVTVFSEHNESSLILFKKYKFNNIKIVIEPNLREEKLDNIINVYKGYNENIKIETINKNYIYNIKEIGNIDNLVFNLTIEDTLYALKLLNKCIENNIEAVYVDILAKREYWFKKGMNLIEEELADLYVDDIIEANGSNILSYESKINKDNNIMEFTKLIYRNIDLWHKYKQKLYDTSLFEHDYNNQQLVKVNLYKLNNEEKELLLSIINGFKKLELIKTNNDENSLEVTFLSDTLKSFIFKSGTWLEILTESVVKDISTVDDVKSGVVFLWNKPKGNIKNELDVVAVKDSIMVIISCKDSSKYDENTLNELKVYSDKLGGENTKKILVATKRPIKSSIFDRAKEMDINIIILNKDLNKFKDELEYIINKK